MQLPAHLQSDYDQLTEGQKRKFQQLLQWTNPSGMAGISLPITDIAFENMIKMVKNMGENPDTPIEPDRTVNHDWDFDPKQNKGK